GCAFSAGWFSAAANLTTDFLGLPTTDVYGDSLNNGYQAVTMSGGYIDLGNGDNAAAMAINGADDAATRIRHGASVPALLPHSGSSLSSVVIYSLGLGNAPYPLSPDLLQRISNDPSSTIHDSSYPDGLYVATPAAA